MVAEITGVTGLRHRDDWPRLSSSVPNPAGQEEQIAAIVRQMTVREKVGQILMPELADLRPEDVRDYAIGSALNGAGIWPGGERHARVQRWVQTVDTFWCAAEEAYAGRPFRVPFAWATDAVHGHNNVFGATIFPHNIGLGAARDPGLLRRIGEATAREIAATGMDWTFAPTVTVPRDRRWGRYYEGYAEDPEVVHDYARAVVEGLQGTGGSFLGPERVICSLKHWVGDGATVDGGDRGVARCSEDLLRNLHAVGFYSGIEAGAQCVMASFTSWDDPANYDPAPQAGDPYNGKVHGSRYLITDVLKNALGFDGVVLSDWDAHAEVAGCTPTDAGNAINAGLDVLMVAGRATWQGVFHRTIEQIESGFIAMERLDDAVTRVLRLKARAGLWDRPRPAERRYPPGVLGSAQHRALSREAVRKSLVLLKNDDAVLPLRRSARILVAGSGADDIQKQTGGWTLTWQGDDVTAADLPGCSTVADAVRAVVGAANCLVDPHLEVAGSRDVDAAIVVIGEDSYAEMRGTIKPWRPLDYRRLKASYAADLEVLERLRADGVPVVTVMFTGRPLYCTDVINLSAAFVAAWLPGPEGHGITDLLFAPAAGQPRHDFQGRLGFSWPGRRSASAMNSTPAHLANYRVPAEEQASEGDDRPLFGYGYGLTLAGATRVGPLPVDEDVPPPPAAPVPHELVTVGTAADPRLKLRVGGHNTWSRQDIATGEPTDILVLRAFRFDLFGSSDALSLQFKGFPTFVYAQWPGGPRDLRGYAERGGGLRLRLRQLDRPTRPVLLCCHDDYPAQPGVDLVPLLSSTPLGQWTTITVSGARLLALGTDLRHVDVPFMLYTEGTAHLEISRVSWVDGRTGEEGG